MTQGWIKLHRKMLDNPVVMKDVNHFAVWVYLLLNATHEDRPVIFNGKKIILKSGQLITGRKKIADELNIKESTVRRILDNFKNDQQIDQQTSTKNRLISIVNWSLYQQSDQQIDQQVTTNKNIKNNKNNKNERKDNPNFDDIKVVLEYLNEKVGAKFSTKSKNSIGYINGRLSEGYTTTDLMNVVDLKVEQWGKSDSMKIYLRPSTLFCPKNFENYINEWRVKCGNREPVRPVHQYTAEELDAIFGEEGNPIFV